MAKKKAYKGSSVKRKSLVEMYGVAELLKSIEKAGGDVDAAVKKAVDKSLAIVGEDMQKFMADHKQSGDTMQSYEQTMASIKDNIVEAMVGYDVQNGGLPAIFLDVGTTAGENGTPRRQGYFFRYYAVENNRAAIEKIQRETLNEILKGLK